MISARGSIDWLPSNLKIDFSATDFDRFHGNHSQIRDVLFKRGSIVSISLKPNIHPYENEPFFSFHLYSKLIENSIASLDLPSKAVIFRLILMQSSEIDARVELLLVLCDEYDWNNQLLQVGPHLKEDVSNKKRVIVSSLRRLSFHNGNKERIKTASDLQLPQDSKRETEKKKKVETNQKNRKPKRLMTFKKKYIPLLLQTGQQIGNIHHRFPS